MLLMKHVRIVSSPWLADYEDDVAPPWEYPEHDFITWVEEVFFENKRSDLTFEEAVETLVDNKYQIEIFEG